jgi:CRISPR-associated protein Csd2
MPAKDLATVIDQRYDFVFLFDVKDGNPNGDPDAGNLPRLDPQTLQGFTTDGCIKRKIRNSVEIIKGIEAMVPEQDETLKGKLRYEIYFKQQGVLNEINRRAFKALGTDEVEGLAEQEGDEEESDETAAKTKRKGKQVKDPNTASSRIDSARLWMCKNFYDVRTFGAVMSTGVNAGQVRGPVQITYARSIDPILPTEASITRKSVNKQEEANKQILKHGFVTGTMGRKNTVPYALYRGNGFVNAHLAMGEKGTGFTYGDLKLFFDAMLRMFDFDTSSSHGTMGLRDIHVFEHASPLGNERAFKLLERIHVKPIIEDDDPERRSRPARSFRDYADRISVDLEVLPAGVAHYHLPEDTKKLFPIGSE